MNFFHEGVQVPFNIVSGVTVDPGEYDDDEVALVLITDQSAPLSLSVNIKDGGLFGGGRFSAVPSIKYRPHAPSIASPLVILRVVINPFFIKKSLN